MDAGEAAGQVAPNFDFAGALSRVAIVLASVSILAGPRTILRVALVVGVAATLMMLDGYFLILPNLL